MRCVVVKIAHPGNLWPRRRGRISVSWWFAIRLRYGWFGIADRGDTGTAARPLPKSIPQENRRLHDESKPPLRDDPRRDFYGGGMMHPYLVFP